MLSIFAPGLARRPFGGRVYPLAAFFLLALVPAAAHAEPPEAADEDEDEEDEDDEDDDDGDDDDGGGGFFIEDLTEDPEALARETQLETKEVEGESGTLRGTIKDATTGDPILGAYVEAVGTEYAAKTGPDGTYELPLPVGTHTIRIRSDVTHPRKFDNVVIVAGESQDISVELQPMEGASLVVEVEAEMNRESEGAQMLARKESSGSRDIMSRDEIQKSGGGSTASAAKRVVGVTLVGGRFIFVRGLGHRYVNTLFDGARVPSPEPELRTVPLDIFPSSALAAINVQKTFTPDTPGDFVGGSVQLESREVPDELVVTLGAEIAGNTQTSFRDFLTHKGHWQDNFGAGNIPRALPSAIPRGERANAVDARGQPLYTPEQLEQRGESLDRDTRILRGSLAPPNWAIKGSLGYGFEPHKHGKLGFYAAAGYTNEHQTRRWDAFRQFSVSGDELIERVDYDALQTTFTVGWSALGLVKYDIDKQHRLSWVTFYSRESDDTTRRMQGRAEPVTGDVELLLHRQRYVTRSILFNRLGGTHEFPAANDAELRWFGSYSQARRDEPHLRDTLFDDRNEDGVFEFRQGEGSRYLFTDLVDHTENGALDVKVPFRQWRGLDGYVKVGGWIEGKQRLFEARRFSFRRDGPVPAGIGIVYTNELVGAPGQEDVTFSLQEQSDIADSYEASQEIYASYAMFDLPFVRWARLVAGARFEASNMQVEAYDIFNPGEPTRIDPVRLEDRDWLPAVSLVFSPTDKQNIRLSATRTLGRPEFREMAPFQFTDFVGGATVRGNAQLVSTKVWNADLRWEWFPSATEVVAVSAFYKSFDKPIERILLTQSGNFIASYKNANAANNLGLELEARKTLEFLWERLRDVSVGLNLTYVYSRVDLGQICDPSMDEDCSFDSQSDRDVSTTRVRPMQDQSPYVINAYLAYDNEDFGTNLRLLYNTEGRRIDRVGALGVPDVYFEPRHELHFVLNQRLYYERLQLQVLIENILNSPAVWRQGSQVAEKYPLGTDFALALSYTF